MNRQTKFSRTAAWVFIGLLLAASLAGALNLAGDPHAMDVAAKYQAPSFRHLFGTDNFGRDVLARVLSGATHTFSVVLAVIGISGCAGLLLGSAAGYFGGWVDAVITRLSDVVFSFPGVLLALVFVSVSGPGYSNTILALGILFTPSFTRIIRAGTAQQKDMKYVELARIYGAAPGRIMLVHILPNLSATILSAFTVGFANAILAEASLSYLGLGVQPPDASWGKMLADSQASLFLAPWMLIFPGLAIVLAVLGFHLLGESVRGQSRLEVRGRTSMGVRGRTPTEVRQ